jgi:hypothetical protein
MKTRCPDQAPPGRASSALLAAIGALAMYLVFALMVLFLAAAVAVVHRHYTVIV